MKTNQNHQRIAIAFDRLFRTYGPLGQGSTPEEVARDRMERVKVYFDAVAMYPEDDVEAAVDALLAGSAPGVNPNFAPPAPVVASECRRQMNLRLRRLELERMARPQLPPPDIEKTPEARERAKAKVAEFLASLSAPDSDVEATKRRNEQFAKTNARFYPDMSDEAVKARLMRGSGTVWTAGDEDSGGCGVRTRKARCFHGIKPFAECGWTHAAFATLSRCWT